jgi:hypothetical protein
MDRTCQQILRIHSHPTLRTHQYTCSENIQLAFSTGIHGCKQESLPIFLLFSMFLGIYKNLSNIKTSYWMRTRICSIFRDCFYTRIFPRFRHSTGCIQESSQSPDTLLDRYKTRIFPNCYIFDFSGYIRIFRIHTSIPVDEHKNLPQNL